MINLLWTVMDVLSSGLGWRGLLCFVVGVVAACVLEHYGVALIWKFDIPILVVLLGIGLGIYWDERA